MALAENLKRIREAAGFTREQLAVRAGITSSTIARIENGYIHPPRLRSLQALAEALDVSLAQLVEDSPAPEAAAS